MPINKTNHRLQPAFINQVMEELLAKTEGPVSMLDLVNEITQRGLRNAKNQPYTRQAVHWRLKDPRNARGVQLLEQNEARRARGAFVGTEAK